MTEVTHDEALKNASYLSTGDQLKDAMTEFVRRMRAGEVMEVPA